MSIFDNLLATAMMGEGGGGGGGGSSDFMSVTYVADSGSLAIYTFSEASWEANLAQILMENYTNTNTTIGLPTTFNGFYAIEQEASLNIVGSYSNIDIGGTALWKIDGDCTVSYVGGGED